MDNRSWIRKKGNQLLVYHSQNCKIAIAIISKRARVSSYQWFCSHKILSYHYRCHRVSPKSSLSHAPSRRGATDRSILFDTMAWPGAAATSLLFCSLCSLLSFLSLPFSFSLVLRAPRALPPCVPLFVYRCLSLSRLSTSNLFAFLASFHVFFLSLSQFFPTLPFLRPSLLLSPPRQRIPAIGKKL